jgi:iron complex transport system substrate-binding protein
VDDRGRTVQLAQPARRIVSLAPHLTELLYAVGAGERIVGTVDFSDYPPDALAIPRVGSATRLDLERILALQPDLVLAWSSGNLRAAVERLEALGLTVYHSEPAGLAGVATDLRRLGLLAGTEALAEAAAVAFERRIDALRARHAGQPPVRVFYQVWDRPLMTVNDRHLIGEAIRLCGGVNLFGHLPALVPQPGLEDVLAANPEAIVVGGPGEHRPDWLEPWWRWDALPAVRGGHLYFIPPSLLQRHGPRLAEGSEALCAVLDTVRRQPAPEPAP